MNWDWCWGPAGGTRAVPGHRGTDRAGTDALASSWGRAGGWPGGAGSSPPSCPARGAACGLAGVTVLPLLSPCVVVGHAVVPQDSVLGDPSTAVPRVLRGAGLAAGPGQGVAAVGTAGPFGFKLFLSERGSTPSKNSRDEVMVFPQLASAQDTAAPPRAPKPTAPGTCRQTPPGGDAGGRGCPLPGRPGDGTKLQDKGTGSLWQQFTGKGRSLQGARDSWYCWVQRPKQLPQVPPRCYQLSRASSSQRQQQRWAGHGAGT